MISALESVPLTLDARLASRAGYRPNGVLDPSFGVGGVALTDFGWTDGTSAFAVQADGKLVVAGFTTFYGSLDFATARYLTS
jgi:hypothetical protein